MNHTKRTETFRQHCARLAEKVINRTIDDDERIDIANILRAATTDSACITKAAEDEPIFTLRGKDPVARAAIDRWMEISIREGLHNDKLADAERCLSEFRSYFSKIPVDKKAGTA